MKKAKYIFNGLEFSSMANIDKYMQNLKNEIIYDKNIEIIYKDSKYYAFFIELLNHHLHKDEKIGCGIDYFYFIKDAHNKDQLRIQRLDGTNIDCSYYYSKITKPTDIKHYLNEALRKAIQDQIDDYKQTLIFPLHCKICRNELSYYEIDHIIPFDNIKKDFLLDNALNIPTEFYDDIYGSCRRMFKTDDIHFENRWKIYHKNNAKYQVLCKSCNLTKGKKMCLL